MIKILFNTKITELSIKKMCGLLFTIQILNIIDKIYIYILHSAYLVKTKCFLILFFFFIFKSSFF